MNKLRGFTLVEIIIFTTLLSLLLSSFIYFVYGVNSSDGRLIQEIHDEYAR